MLRQRWHKVRRTGLANGIDANLPARFLINSWEGSIVRMKIVDSRAPLDDFFTVAFPPIDGRNIAILQ